MQKLCLLFPGGGTQYIGMGKALFNESKLAKRIFEEASDLLGQDIRKICFEGPFDVLSLMENSQPAIYVCSIAAFKVFEERVGIVPPFAAGHSLGEYSALTCAGVINFQDGIHLVKARGQILQDSGQKNEYSMLAINKLSADLIEIECLDINRKGGKVFISVYNSPLQVVVAGERPSILQLARKVEELNGEINYLNITSPSHCSLMIDAAQSLKVELLKYKYGDFGWKVISNLDGLPYADNKDIVDRLVSHMFTPVKWNDSINYILKNGIADFIDMGPQSVLCNLTKFISDHANSYSFDSIEGVERVLKAFNKKESDFLLFLKRSLVMAVSTQNLNKDLKEYNKQVAEPYKELLNIRNLFNKDNPLSTNDVKHILFLLNNILKYKLVTEEERYKLIKDSLLEANILNIDINLN